VTSRRTASEQSRPSIRVSARDRRSTGDLIVTVTRLAVPWGVTMTLPAIPEPCLERRPYGCCGRSRLGIRPRCKQGGQEDDEGGHGEGHDHEADEAVVRRFHDALRNVLGNSVCCVAAVRHDADSS
jgi:hypothetical protein